MNKIIKTMCRKVLYAAAMFTMMLIILTPISTTAADNYFRFTVRQVFHTSSAAVSSTFTYILKPLESGNPMPAGSTAEGYAFTITGNGNAEVGTLHFNRQGTYRYELFQNIGTVKPGYTYDRQTYKIEAYVDASLKVKVIMLKNNGTKTEDILFENSYNVLPSNPELMFDPPVVKTVFGSPSYNSVFTFRLQAHASSYPMPAGSVSGVKNIKITGSGSGSFGVWSYDKEGIYYYTVSEVNSGEKGYAYDKAVYKITDTVKEENGTLTVSRIVTNDNNKQVTSFTFINYYNGSSNPPPATIPTVPQTTTVPPPTTAAVNPPAATLPPQLPTPTNEGPNNPPAIIIQPETKEDKGEPPVPIEIMPPLITDRPIRDDEDEESHGDSGIPRYSGMNPGDDGGTNPGNYTKPNPNLFGIYGPKTGDGMNRDFYIKLLALGGAMTAGATVYLIFGGKSKKKRSG